MTTTSLHGSSSSSFIDRKKGGKKPTRLAIASEGVGYRRCRGCRRRQMTTLAFVVLEKRMKKPTPSRNCKRGVGYCRCRWLPGRKGSSLSRNCKRGGGWFCIGRNPPRLVVACKGV